MTTQAAIFRLRNIAGWWEGDSNAERVLEEFRGHQLRETWNLHDKIVDGQATEIHNHLLTIAVLQAENRNLRAQLK